MSVFSEPSSAFFPIFVSSLIHHLDCPQWMFPYGVLDCTLALILSRYGSVLALWRWTLFIARHWIKIPGVKDVMPVWLVSGGPLGPGCSKIVELATGCLLWRMTYKRLPLKLGPLPSFWTWSIVLLLSAVTNLVLSLWSQQNKSRGDHSGVNSMVESSRGRLLSLKEHLQLLVWAILNAICEEVASRGLWMQEFILRGRLSSLHANVLQAISFGLWHFHGIPSGWTGVGLTFVYGLVMGFLTQHGGGLLLPIVAHSIADYFIFAVIARQGGFK
jgi:membrane protease YdiL (CAAX protease family)